VEAGDGEAEQKHGRIQEGNHCVCFRVCAEQRYELDTRAKESERSKLNTRVIMVEKTTQDGSKQLEFVGRIRIQKI
jgi:hypothetical protein